MNTTVYMNASLADDGELEVAKQHCNVCTTRRAIPENSLVIGRYSVLPFHKELEDEVEEKNSRLINSFEEHCYVADMREWYQALVGLTPKTWFSLEEFIAAKPEGSFVLKGQTNSKKQQWDTHMFAATAADVPTVYQRLCDDGLIGEQNIYIRAYVPLRTFGVGIRGLPITEEYRFFVYEGEVVASGWYWSQFPEVRDENSLRPSLVDQDFLRSAIALVQDEIPFFVMDVARTAQGDWMVVELNDGCMSGLSDVDPSELYANLSEACSKVTSPS